MTRTRAKAKSAKELAALIRAAQGTSRCQYKPGLEPGWWPSEVPFLNTSQLSAEDISKALLAASDDQGVLPLAGETQTTKAKGEETVSKEGVENLLNLEEKENKLANIVAASSGPEKDIPPASVRDQRSKQLAGETQTERAKDEENIAKGDVEKPLNLAKKENKLANILAASISRDVDVVQQGEQSAVTEACVPQSGPADGEVLLPTPSVPVEAKETSSEAVADSIAMPPPRSRQPAVQRSEAPDENSTRVLEKAATCDLVPRTPVSHGANGAPRNWLTAREKAALIEDAERRTILSIEELRIGMEERQKRFTACFKFKQDDIRDAVELVVQRMPRHIQDMPINDYILQFGGDHRNVVVSQVQDAVESHMQAVVEKRKASLTGKSQVAQSPDEKSALRSIADQAAKTARKKAAPETTRRATRRGAQVLTAATRQVSVSKKAGKIERNGMGITKLGRSGGIAKAIPRSRVGRSAGKQGRLAREDEKENVLASDADDAADDDRSVEDSPSILAQMRAHEKELQALRKKLEMTRRRGGGTTTRKLR